MKKATTKLFLEVEYDPEATDPEGLACAMDRLLETALSIPGILDEYNSPRFGEFLVLPSSQDTNTPRQEGVVEPVCEGPREYRLTIDGPLFRSQRKILLKLVDLIRQGLVNAPSPGDVEPWEGLIQLTDEIADQAHDRFGVDCLIEADDNPVSPSESNS